MICRPTVTGPLAALLLLAAIAAPAAAQLATTVQLPTFGVAVDANGVLSVRSFADPTGQLHAERLRAARAQLPGDLCAPSRLRKVSLVRLQRALQRQLDAGQAPDETMRCLAGLQRLQYVFCYPEARDIVIAGPAEGFAADLSGRHRGIHTGRPVLELEDLLVALRAFPPGRQEKVFIGCTIDPTPEAMSRLQQFQQGIPHAVPEYQRQEVGMKIAEGMRQSLGLAPIRVFGVPADSHFAQVLIEADYRMKLIGLGLEQPPVKLASYFDLLGNAPPRQNALQRWWFTPNYECVKVSEDRLAMELVGEGVQLLTEAKLVGPDGRLSSGAPSSRASETFTAGFTRKFPELAERSPVYAQLRNLIDMTVAAAFVRQEGYTRRAGWSMDGFGEPKAAPVRNGVAPKHAPAAVNAAWRGSRFLAAAGGGVSIRPDEALLPERVMADKDGRLSRLRTQLGTTPPPDRWWWD